MHWCGQGWRTSSMLPDVVASFDRFRPGATRPSLTVLVPESAEHSRDLGRSEECFLLLRSPACQEEKDERDHNKITICRNIRGFGK